MNLFRRKKKESVGTVTLSPQERNIYLGKLKMASTAEQVENDFITVQQAIRGVNEGDTSSHDVIYNSSLIMSPVLWLARNIASMKLYVKDENDEPVEDSVLTPTLLNLLDKRMMISIAINYLVYGNAFLEITRRTKNTPFMGLPTKLEVMDPTWVIPKSSDNKVTMITDSNLSYYEVCLPGKTAGKGRRVKPENMIHIAFGINPSQPVSGISPLAAGAREVFIDIEANKMASTVLNNTAIFGVIVSPKGESGLQEEEAESMKKKLEDEHTGTNRGRVNVFSESMQTDVIPMNLKDLALSDLRDLNESRICALWGIPPAVVNLGVGIAQIKVGATIRDQRIQTWDNAVSPTTEDILNEINRQLDLPGGYSLGFRQPAVVAAERSKLLYAEGIITLNEMREELGLPDIKGGDVVKSTPLNPGAANNSDKPEDKAKPTPTEPEDEDA